MKNSSFTRGLGFRLPPRGHEAIANPHERCAAIPPPFYTTDTLSSGKRSRSRQEYVTILFGAARTSAHFSSLAQWYRAKGRVPGPEIDNRASPIGFFRPSPLYLDRCPRRGGRSSRFSPRQGRVPGHRQRAQAAGCATSSRPDGVADRRGSLRASWSRKQARDRASRQSFLLGQKSGSTGASASPQIFRRSPNGCTFQGQRELVLKTVIGRPTEL